MTPLGPRRRGFGLLGVALALLALGLSGGGALAAGVRPAAAGVADAHAAGVAPASASAFTGAGAGAAAPLPPLAATRATPAAAWAMVPMGILAQPTNTFWQLFVQRGGSARWSLATPPGVADNGGLVGTPAPGGGFDVGFETSLLLGFSPVSTTTDGGRTWVPAAAPLPAPLAAVPDSLSRGGSGDALALAASGTAYASRGELAGWRRLASTPAIAASAGARACRLARLTAVAVVAPVGGAGGAGAAGGSGGAVAGATLGGDCNRSGVVGVLEQGRAGWQLAGPELPPAEHDATAAVLRLDTSSAGLAALVELSPPAGRGSAARLVAAARSGSGGWRASPAFELPAGARLVATGVGSTGAMVVTYEVGAERFAALERAPAGPFVLLAQLPARTEAVVGLAGGGAEAIAADRSEMTAYRLAPGSSRWQRTQQLDVPIEYGSSG
jgi:hypothetical protein